MKVAKEHILKGKASSVYYDRQHRLAYIVWEGTLSLESYQEPFLYLLHQFDPKPLGILSDNRKQGVVSPQLRNWLQQEGAPQAIARGLKFYFAVSEMNVFKQYYLTTIFKLLNNSGLTLKLFQDYDKAEEAIKKAITELNHFTQPA